MIDREKVIKALECCRGYCDDETGCPYFDTEDDCEERMKDDDAVALLKAQEPRVMAPEEVHALNNGDVVWLEFRGDLCVCAGIFHKVDMLITDMSFETIGGTIFPDIHNGYNVRWRCWNSKPTDEQRKEVEWND